VLPLLRQVSRRSQGYEHAPVCRLWSTKSEEAQVSVRVPKGRSIPAGVLLGQISAFRGLQSLHVDDESATGLTTQFLADLALQHGSTLRHLRYSVPDSSMVSGNDAGYQ